MDTKLKLPSKATFRTFQVSEAVNSRVPTRHHLPRVLEVAGAEEGSQTFPALAANWQILSAVLGLENERALKMDMRSLAPTLRRMLRLNLPMTRGRIDPLHQSPCSNNPRLMGHPMHHRIRLATLGRPKEAISRHTMHLPRSSGLVVELVGTMKLVGLAEDLGWAGPRNHNRSHSRKRGRTLSRGREIDSMDSLKELPDSLALGRDMGTDQASQEAERRSANRD